MTRYTKFAGSRRARSARGVFQQHPLFTSSDIEFLKSLGRISDHLQAFIDLKEELLNVGFPQRM